MMALVRTVMGFNPFMVVATGLMLGASGWSFIYSNPKTGIIYAAYAVANAVLSTIKV